MTDRRSAPPRCRFCRKTDEPANLAVEHFRAGIARGSTRYTMKPYYHHAACLAAFEAHEVELNEAARRRDEAELAELRKELGR